MPSAFPGGLVIREFSWKKSLVEKVVSMIEKKWEILLCFYTQLEISFKLNFIPGWIHVSVEFSSQDEFHPGMRFHLGYM